MNDANANSRARCLLVWLAVTAVVGTFAVALLPLPVSLDGSFDALLVRLCSWALLVCAGWFWVATTVVVLAALAVPAGHAPRAVRAVPAPVRRMILAACGVALTSGIAAPALATPGAVPADLRDHSGRVVIAGLPYPDRAVPDQGARRQPPAPPPPARRALAVVRPGDTLWSIAAARLPDDATDARIATAWRELYDLNHDVIGADPDLIEPGQHLTLPPSLHLPSEGAPS
ncbi:LysM peptidoglycan-binding domain-containing protein [Nocardioides sp. DS6]|uniref:LysM peptidoglycan-binding domain-containing protein n=1 Tax=Nocardioides eburneus TaxID=3231482 RepID=A0ABV3T2X6_9ACTN